MIKWYLLWIVVFIAGVIGVLHLPRNAGVVPSAAAPVMPAFDQDRAWKDLVHQVDAGYRVPGTKTHRQVRDWLVRELSGSAATVMTQPFTHPLGGQEVQMWNIIASYPGVGAAPREQVLLAAHWDTRPTADKDPDPAKRGLPIAGANDGASGVAVLLEIGRQLKANPIARDVVIVLFDGEDYGPQVDNMLLGSKYYAAHLPEKKPAWGILLDMVGDKDLTIYREPNSDYYAKAVNDRIFLAAKTLGFMAGPGKSGFVDKPYRYAIEDDHIPLNKAGIPTVDLIDFDYPVWHTRNDTPEQCSADSLGIVGKTVLYALQAE